MGKISKQKIKFHDDSLSSLTNLQKAAILLSTLGPRSNQLIFQHMKDIDIKQILEAMGQLTKVPIPLVKMVLQEFYALLSEKDHFLFDETQDPKYLENVLGKERASKLKGLLQNPLRHQNLECLALVDDRILLNFLLREHPQTVALILLHLPVSRKKKLFEKLPLTLQSEVILRMGHLDQISPDHLATLDEILQKELSTIGHQGSKRLGGTTEMADLLNTLDKDTQKRILAELEIKNSSIGQEIRDKMLVFEDLLFCDEGGLRQLLKNIPHSTWVLALKVSSNQLRQKIYENMSQRAAQILKEDGESLGPTPRSKVESAQQEILRMAKKMQDQGQLILQRKDSNQKNKDEWV